MAVYKEDVPYVAIIGPRPKQPGNDIDMYLEPLVDDLMTLWHDGVRVWDEYKREHFTLQGVMFVKITDLPGLGSVSGQLTKGYKEYVVCLDDTDARWLINSKKMVYMGHRRFLFKYHSVSVLLAAH
jgi:hypothetical protein